MQPSTGYLRPRRWLQTHILLGDLLLWVCTPDRKDEDQKDYRNCVVPRDVASSTSCVAGAQLVSCDVA